MYQSTTSNVRLASISLLSETVFPLSSVPIERFCRSDRLSRQEWPNLAARTRKIEDFDEAPRCLTSAGDCCLVLYYPRMLPVQDDEEGWTFVLHETAGMWQEAKRLAIRRIQMSQKGSDIALGIARSFASSNVSAAYATFDQLSGYRQQINEYGLDCNRHIQDFAEAFYPIDLCMDALTIFGVREAPIEVIEMIDSELLGLAIMAPNCPGM